MLRTLLVAAVLFAPALAAAQPCTATTPPTTPADVTATRQGTGVLVSWTDATVAAACRATRFYVEASQNGQNIREVNVPPNESGQQVTLPDVPYGGLWRFAVRSFSSRGVSPQASTYINDIAPSCFQMPDPVTQIVASSSGRTVTVQWLHPGSCTLTGFVIEAAGPDGRVVYSESFQNPSMRSFSATAPPGVWYVRVYAESHRRVTVPSGWTAVSVQ